MLDYNSIAPTSYHMPSNRHQYNRAILLKCLKEQQRLQCTPIQLATLLETGLAIVDVSVTNPPGLRLAFNLQNSYSIADHSIKGFRTPQFRIEAQSPHMLHITRQGHETCSNAAAWHGTAMVTPVTLYR
jgi:hypothetical protein